MSYCLSERSSWFGQFTRSKRANMLLHQHDIFVIWHWLSGIAFVRVLPITQRNLAVAAIFWQWCATPVERNELLWFFLYSPSWTTGAARGDSRDISHLSEWAGPVKFLKSKYTRLMNWNKSTFQTGGMILNADLKTPINVLGLYQSHSSTIPMYIIFSSKVNRSIIRWDKVEPVTMSLHLCIILCRHSMFVFIM